MYALYPNEKILVIFAQRDEMKGKRTAQFILNEKFLLFNIEGNVKRMRGR